MTPPKIEPKVSAATSNYVSSDGAWQSINTARVSVPVWKGATWSNDIGLNQVVNFSEGESKTTFIYESKFKQNFGNNFRGYLRYRKYGDTDQLRASVGYSVPVNKKLSLYTDGYYTTKLEKGKDTFSFATGVDYKINKHWSVWSDVFKSFNTTDPTFNGWEKGQWSLESGLVYTY